MSNEEIFSYALNDFFACDENHEIVKLEFGVGATSGVELMGPYVRVDGELYRVTRAEIDACFLSIWGIPITDQEAIDECAEAENARNLYK